VACNCHHQDFFLALVSSVNSFLHQTAAMLMARDLNTLLNQFVVYKLLVFARPRLKNFDEHMIAVDFSTKLPNVFF
jgi:hypothetical protein